MNRAAKFVFGLAVAVVTLGSFAVPDAPSFQKPALARIFFFHFPCTLVATWFIFAGAYLSVRYMRSPDRKWDVKAVSANELGLLFGILVMATGILFSKVQWGEWWQWDPRQTSFLLVLLIYFAYFVLRTGYSDENKRASYSAAYSSAAALPNFFLIFVFPRLPQIQRVSFHPTNTISGGLLDGAYGITVICTVAMSFVIAAWLYRLRVAAGMFELQVEDFDGKLEAGGGHPAPTSVVRPISVPDED